MSDEYDKDKELEDAIKILAHIGKEIGGATGMIPYARIGIRAVGIYWDKVLPFLQRQPSAPAYYGKGTFRNAQSVDTRTPEERLRQAEENKSIFLALLNEAIDELATAKALVLNRPSTITDIEDDSQQMESSG